MKNFVQKIQNEPTSRFRWISLINSSYLIITNEADYPPKL